MNKIRWIICDDSKYVRFTYVEGLKKYNELENVGECETAIECVDMCKQLKPDMVLLDVQLENGMLGTDFIYEIKDVSPDIKVIILSSYKLDEYVMEAFGNGADGYILKEYSINDVYKSIIGTYNDNTIIPTEIAKVLAQATKNDRIERRSLLYSIDVVSSLTKSEFEVLKGCYDGKTYQEIADERFVSISTVRVLGARVIKKFSAPNMEELIKDLKKLNFFEFINKDNN